MIEVILSYNTKQEVEEVLLNIVPCGFYILILVQFDTLIEVVGKLLSILCLSLPHHSVPVVLDRIVCAANEISGLVGPVILDLISLKKE